MIGDNDNFDNGSTEIVNDERGNYYDFGDDGSK
jgi:hypothetical protein